MNSQFPQGMRRERSVKLAIGFLAGLNVAAFPLDPYAVIKKMGWELKTYAWFAGIHGITDQCGVMDMRRDTLMSEDALVSKRDGKYMILYNEQARPHARINFTLAHEIGHVILGHLDPFQSGTLLDSGLTDIELRILDAEADCFAGNCLMPAILAFRFNTTLSPEECRWVFRVSKKAWETRLSLFRRDYACVTRDLRESQTRQFRNFVTSIEARKGNIYRKIFNA